MRCTSRPEKGGMAMWRRHFSRFGGLFIFLFSIGFCVYIWDSVLTRGIYWPKASFLLPFFGFLGLSMMCYPVKPDASTGQNRGDDVKWKNLPIGQKAIILTGAALGVLQLTFFKGYWSF